ncbi:MAG TPA: hypothetical protein VFL16_10150 [Steroidobacteraceae bacterium]|jgi:hypothetical protein|nr:hypothetical protein [Steroidobacteraceae bacterium]
MSSGWAAAGLLALCACVHAEEPPYADEHALDEVAVAGVGTASVPMGYVNVKDPWIDRAHQGVFNAVWRSAMRVDQWFGATSGDDEATYMQTSGSIAPALLYDGFDGLQPKLRFQVDVPLPRLNERLHAFFGRVNHDEYVTESRPGSGAFARQYGPVQEDETLFGLRYRSPKQGSRFQADAGLRVRSPLDPFVKGSWRFDHGSSEETLFSFRETAFWQNSEKFGFTSRMDIERIVDQQWLLRLTLSGTVSQRTEGVKSYVAFNAIRGMPGRRAFCAELFSENERKEAVPLGNYGVKLAYRKSVTRDWLVLETRLSLTFPKDEPWQAREATWGVGVGLEMFLGTDQFLARPVTF